MRGRVYSARWYIKYLDYTRSVVEKGPSFSSLDVPIRWLEPDGLGRPEFYPSKVLAWRGESIYAEVGACFQQGNTPSGSFQSID